jgi:cytochrome P450
VTLFKKDKLIDYTSTMVQIIDKHLTHWQPYVKNNVPIMVQPYLIEIALDIVLSTVLGGAKAEMKNIPSIVQHLKSLVSPWIFPLVKMGRFPMPLYFKYQNNLQQLKATAENIIKQCFNKDLPQDNLVVILANAYGYERYEQLDKQMKEHLMSEVISMIIGGHETTIVTLINLLAVLSLYPCIANNIHEEVISVLGSRNPTYADLANLTYTNATIKETLRLWPPSVATDRSPLEDDIIDGYIIKKNEFLIIPIYALQRHPAYWINPLGFDPSRFLIPLTEAQQNTFIPFGVGSHSCLGGQFAMTEIKLIIAMLSQRFRLALMPGRPLDRRIHIFFYRINPKITMQVFDAENEKNI